MAGRQLPCGRSGAGTLVLVCAMALAACSTPPVRTGPDLLSGRLSVQVEGQPERSLSADFELDGSAERGALRLSGPLGTTAAMARWAPGEAVLTTSQGETREPDLDTLATRALGEAVPMAALFDWLRGRPWPGAPHQPRRDGGTGFEQLGWQVALERHGSGLVEARRLAPPMVSLRIKLLQG